MANVMLTLGGPYRYNRCPVGRNTVYDESTNGVAERIAGEYMHGLFTVGNSLNPMFSEGQAEALDAAKVAVGDFIGLFEIPANHTLLDVAVRTFPVQAERGYQGKLNADGLVVSVEAREYSQDTLEPTGKTIDLVTALNGVAVNEAVFKRSSVKPTDGGHWIESDKFIVLGLKVDSLPSEKTVKLSDITARVEVTGHVFDYECPIHV
nr:MAG TPA: hypothetical protein [Bacteriophage sp.]